MSFLMLHASANGKDGIDEFSLRSSGNKTVFNNFCKNGASYNIEDQCKLKCAYIMKLTNIIKAFDYHLDASKKKRKEKTTKLHKCPLVLCNKLHNQKGNFYGIKLHF